MPTRFITAAVLQLIGATARACGGVIILTGMLVCAPAFADLRLVVDVSKAMQEADPDNLRGAGIELLARSMPDDGYGGLWSYSKLTQQLVNYGPSDGLWKQMVGIHGRNLNAGSRYADPTVALQAATWDIQKVDRGPIDLVLLSNGALDTGLTELEHQNLRQLLLNTWASKLRAGRIRVHAIAFSSADRQTNIDDTLLRQMADLSGGLYKTVSNLEQLQGVLMDVIRLMQIEPQAIPDHNGRFQIAPGAAYLNALWLHQDQQQSPIVVQPNGARLSRVSSLQNGRWVLAQDFEMVTINKPMPGWWQIEGGEPARLGVFGEVEIRVSNLTAPVIPTDESHAKIQLFSAGELLQHQGFLDLVDVQAWLVDQKSRRPLPVERQGESFNAYFVNLDDGAYDFVVTVTAPTFHRAMTVPFVVANPLRVDVRQGTDGVGAWMNFSHAEIDYRTLKGSAKVRKPPQVGQILPAEKLPAGLFHIPIAESEGVVELTFTVSGNYLNGEGFFLKTERQTVTLPLVKTQVLRFNAAGKRLANEVFGVDAEQVGGVAGMNPSLVLTEAEQFPDGAGQERLQAPHEDSLPPLPIWFVGLISGLNLVIGAGIWWVNKPRSLTFALLTLPAEDVAAT